jgi:hypothetical protein
VQPVAYEVFSKTDIEKGDEEFARRLYTLELERAKPRPQPPRGGKKMWLSLFFVLVVVAVGAWLIAKYVPKSDGQDVECLLASSLPASSATTNTTSDCPENFTTNTTAENEFPDTLSF